MSLIEVIALTFAYYHRGESLQDAVLKMYAADLMDLPADEVIKAYESYRRDPKNKTFPLPAQIRAIVQPDLHVTPEELAPQIAARIVGAVTKFGWANAREAEKFIGPTGWAAVTAQGGWSHLCENLGTRISATTFQAQVRDVIKSLLTHGSAVIEARVQLPEKSQPKKSELEKFNWTNRMLGERDEEK